LEAKYLATHIVILLYGKKNEVCPSLQVSKKVFIFLELFCLVCIVAWGQDSLSKKVVVKVVGLSLKFRKKEKPRFI